jgi:uncharacterized delta-60 repeat protein
VPSSPGNNAYEYLTIVNNTNITGNVNANLALTTPHGTNFILGGEYIPLGTALGSVQTAPMTILDEDFVPGTFSFSSPTYMVNQSSNYVDITVTRTNSTGGSVQVSYAAFNGTATSPANYLGTNGTLTFNAGVSSRTFRVQIVPSTVNAQDKTVNLTLYGITAGGKPGLTNAVLTIVNNVFGAGHIAFALATNSVNETAGTAAIVINRLGGGGSSMQVTAITSDGSAVNGTNYVGSTNVVQWASGDVLPKTITIPVLHDGIFTSNRTVNIRLTNGMANGFPNTYVLNLSTVTNSTLVISNTDFPGTVQFSAGAYSVKKYGGFALIPVNRIGGSAGTVTVGYRTMDGTAVQGVNYTSTSGLLTFTNGVVSQYFKVPIMDSANNGLLSLGLVLSNATVVGGSMPWVAQGSPSNAVLNIIDTDLVGEPPGSVDTTYDKFAAFNGNVFALALQTNNYLLAAGDFTMASGIPRQRIVRLKANGALDSSFLSPSSSMGANAQIRSLAVQQDGRILVGGVFTNFNRVAMNRLARLNYDGSLDSQFISGLGSGADSSVYAVAQSPVDGKIYVGGAFGRLDGVVFNGIGRLKTDGKPDTTFNPGGLGANATVYALAVQTDGKVIIGGDFTAVNGVSRNRLARLNADGSLDTSFNIGTGLNDSVRVITLQADGGILIGGLFTTNNGVAMNRIARLNTDGSLDTSFTPGAGANDMVTCIAIQTDNRIVVGGQFTRFSDVYRSRLTRLNPDGTVDPTINFGTGANDFVAAIVVQQGSIHGYPADVPDEKLIIGGGFTQFNGRTCKHLARIFGGSIGGVGTFQFSAPAYQIAENSPISAVITVTRAGGTSGTNANGSGNIIVPFATSNLTAVAGVNYGSVVTNLVFPMGEVQQTVLIPVMEDGVITSNLTVALKISPADFNQVGDQPTAVLTIVNVDSSVAFSSATYQVPKNVVNGVAAISIKRQGSTTGTATVNFSTTTNGTAVAGIDYEPVTNSVVVFGPGVTNVDVTIPVINNALPRGDRTVTLELTNALNTTLYWPSNATLKITDTVFAPGELSFLTTNVVVNEGTATVSLTVIRTNGSSGSVSVSYVTAAGTAIPDVNYLTSSGTITFGDGVISRDITIPLLDNSAVQGTVSFSVNLLNPTGGATLDGANSARIDIVDDEIGLSFVTTTNTMAEDYGSVAVLVQRLGRTNSAVSVNYSTLDGTAQAGIHYSNTSGTLNFSVGEVLKSVTVPFIRNTNATGDIDFTVRLSAPSGALLVAPSNTVVVILDADAGISFTNDTMRVLKNAGYAVITVVCSNPRVEPEVLTTNDIPLKVDYYTVNGTAIAGADYWPASGTLFFTNGIATNTFIVPIYNNFVVTNDRTFGVILTNVTEPGRLTPYAAQTVVIAESNPGFRFSTSNYKAVENTVSTLITVYRTGYTDSVASVDFMIADGTAAAGVNYINTNGTLVFTNGVTSQSFQVALIDNSLIQPNLTAQLQLINPTNGVLVSPSQATLTIVDNDGSYVVPAGSQMVTNYTSHLADGIIRSNDTVQIMFALRDESGLDVVNLIAYLLTTNGVTSPSPASQVYGPLKVGGHAVFRPFTFTAIGTNGQTLIPTFALYDGAKYIGTAQFPYAIGTWTTVFSNTTPIVIRDHTNALPYPSIISVSGIGTTLVKATVTLTNLYHAWPADIAALVVSPSQTNSLLMGNAGAGFSITKTTLTFDDAATNSLPQNSVITNGVYRPTIYQYIQDFP